MQAKNIC